MATLNDRTRSFQGAYDTNEDREFKKLMAKFTPNNREIKEETINDPDYINGVKVTAPAGLYLRWMEGKSDKANKLNGEFKNPLKGINCKDAWGNIWKD